MVNTESTNKQKRDNNFGFPKKGDEFSAFGDNRYPLDLLDNVDNLHPIRRPAVVTNLDTALHW